MTDLIVDLTSYSVRDLRVSLSQESDGNAVEFMIVEPILLDVSGVCAAQR